MTDRYKLSRTEGVCVTVNLLCNKLFLLTPAFFIGNAGSSALFSVIIVFGIALLFFTLFCKKTDGNLFDLLKKPLLQRLFHVLSLLLSLFCCIINFSLLIYFLKSSTFPKSPFLFLAMPFGLGMAVCARNGMKSVGKTAGFFVPFIFSLLTFLLLLHAKDFSFTNLFPVFGKGVFKTFFSGIFLLSSLFEILFLYYMKAFYPRNLAEISKPALGISALLYLVVIGSLLLIGKGDFGTFSLLRTGLIGRSGGFFLLIYTLSGLLYLATVLFFATEMFQKAFSVQDRTPLIVPLALLIIAFSEITFLSPDGQAFLKKAGLLLWLMPFLVPLICILFSKKKKEKQND